MVSTILVRIRLISWTVGIILSYTSYVFGNENEILRALSGKYFDIAAMSALIPVATISLMINSSRNTSRIAENFKKLLAMAVLLLLYISLDIAFFHGGV